MVLVSKKKGYKNIFWDIYDFLQGLRKQLGYNVTFSIIQKDDQMVLGFHFQEISHMQDVAHYEVRFDVSKDFMEPTSVLTTVVLDHVRAYIKSCGTVTDVAIEGAEA